MSLNSNWIVLAGKAERNPIWKWAPITFPVLGFFLLRRVKSYTNSSRTGLEEFYGCLAGTEILDTVEWIYNNTVYIVYAALIMFSLGRIIYFFACPTIISRNVNTSRIESEIVNNKERYYDRVLLNIPRERFNGTWQDAVHIYVNSISNSNKLAIGVCQSLFFFGTLILFLSTISSVILVVITWSDLTALFCK